MTDVRGVLGRLEPRLGEITEGPIPLEGGITNRNYRVRFGERDCVVRLPGKDTSLLGISRDAERIANGAAAELGLAPAVIAGDDECLVTEYVPCRAADASAVRAAAGSLGAALRAFHDSGVQLSVRFWVPELLESFAEVVRERGGKLPPQYATACSLVQLVAEVLPLDDPVPCHDDLLAGNVLLVGDGKAIMLVDWEYAGMGHRLFDLANLAVNNDFEEPDEARLLAAYFGEPPSPARSAALRLMRIVSDAREAAWGVVQGVISELEFDFAAYAAQHFERLEQAAASPRFQESISAAAA
jgi:aminoglycoside phosphotransferase (APT) family kinase protein